MIQELECVCAKDYECEKILNEIRINSSIALHRDDNNCICSAKPFYVTELEINVEDFFEIEKVIFNDPATIIFWKDGAKTVVKCQPGDKYGKEKGLAMCYMKKAMRNKGNFNDQFNMLIDSNYKTKRRRAKKEAKRAAKN